MSYTDDFRHLEIQLKDIKAATNNFSDKPIGNGGFGTVYKGELLLPNGRRMVAFKRLNRKFGQGDVEFWKEITTLSELSHENLASLLHFCKEGDERILVYEYISRQSLDNYLDKASLTWIQRLHICIGAARGIAYLHDPKKTQRRILHRDIKSSNILLDEKWTAKVSDFGLSKVTPANQTRSYLVSNVAGTLGYCDPEYHATAIARRCLNRDHKERPNMIEVVRELEVALHHQQNPMKHEISETKMPTSYGFVSEFDHLKVRLEDIKLATNNFSDNNVIGRGGFGKVYRGELYLPGGQRMVCFKRLDRRLGQGNVEFFKEISLLSRYRHVNLVSLLKICIEGDELILVYDYEARGSLDRYLSEPGLTWAQRLKICVGVAHAINYLHGPGDTRQRVLHRDIKSSNILLNENWTAKVSDFGLSKIGPANQPATYVFSNAVGTPGYCDPVYFETGFLTKESDVYSFGVVLFELMCGKLCCEYSNGHLSQILVNKWRRCYEKKRLDEIIFSDLKEQMDPCLLSTFASMAYLCIKKRRDERPTMEDVVKILEIAVEQQEEFEETMRIQKLRKSILNTSQDQNFINGIHVDDDNTWLAILKGKVCEVISATKCISADSLVHDDTQKSRFPNIVKGGMYNGFTVKVTTQFLSPKTMYTVSLVFKHSGPDHGTHIPFKFRLEGERYYSNSCMTHVRDDGWLMTELYQFTSHKSEHVLGIHFLPLFDITSSRIKYFLEGIEFCPVQYIT
ncbi:putative protein kinase RLK-Pelle-CrRLK1L-1 family [Helianthus annuus]|nr:putative protein kinase RLK-Pelle-CrRLK1L-1 family [Helianthus annuus]